jgi:Protein of unknown function (DUF2752)
MHWDFDIRETDSMRWLTYLAGGGVLAAAALALIGGFPFDTPMPTHAIGWVEPTCGLTRGATAIARGDFATAWRYNPASFLVMGFGVLGVIRTVVGLAAHRWVNVKVTGSWKAWAVLGFALVALWAYQQTNAAFIIHARV